MKLEKSNFNKLYQNLKEFDEFRLVEKQINSEPSWFGFLITLTKKANFSRNKLVEYLESKNIQTRNLFAGNMLKHPMFDHMIECKDYRVVGELVETDNIMLNSFWIGVYPGMSEEMINHMINTIKEFLSSNK